MTPTPWAQAVEAIRKNLSGLCCDGPGCDLCMEVAQDIAKESLPHLLRAVVEGMTDEDVAALDDTLMADAIRRLRERGGTPERKGAEYRAAVLSALTDAAGRVGE